MTVPTLAALIFTIISGQTGKEVAFEALIADLATRDVVFLGEEHDNTVGHQLQAKILAALYDRRADLVISMEMFERDTQGILSDYVQGRVDEETFLKHSRPWPNYKKHYRPIIEFAKVRNLHVIAANVPRRLARRVTAGGYDAIVNVNYVANWITAPQDRYYDAFKRSMADHPGELKPKTIERFYQSQCLKDDTMAEAIYEFLGSRPHRQPLVVHLCGKFHSDQGLGTVSRLLARDPLCQTAVVTMEPCEDPKAFVMKDQGKRAHYILAVPEEPEKEKKDPDAEAVAKKDGDHGEEGKEGEGHDEAEAKKSDAKKESDADEEDDEDEEGEEGERAALGLMPSYDESDERGVPVDAVTPGKGAEVAGIEAGDIIIGLGGKPVVDLNDYMDLMGDHRPGQKIKVKVLRDGKEKTFTVKLGAYGR